MSAKRVLLLLVSAITLLWNFNAIAIGADPKAKDHNAEQMAKGYVDDFLAGKMQPLVDHASPELKALINDAKTLNTIRNQTVGDGAQQTDDKVSITYMRTVKSANGQSFNITATVDNIGVLQGLLIQPAGEFPSKQLDYQTKADVRLPFDGTWSVFWGGRNVKDNYHAVSEQQRFAYDILMTKDDKTHSGIGKVNTDYYCFGQTIISPAKGVVVEAVDGVAENVPGKMNPKELCGNHVVLDLGNKEFLFVAHLQNGSVKVKPGDHVAAGQLLGLCGNSGNSSEPHLHIHLQNTPTIEAGQGLPLQFEHYEADGKPVDRGEPTKGQQIHAVQ